MSPGLRLLNCYYKFGFTLKDFLLRVCDVEVLEFENDTESYLSLLRSSYVGLDSLDAFSRQKFKPSEIIPEVIEVIDRVQTKLFDRAKGRPLNIITMGYRRASHRNEVGPANMSRPGICNFFPNTNITALRAPEWKLLLSRIGEDALYYLLLETSIFLSLPNDSFCQLTGTPVFELTPHTPLTSTGFPGKTTKRPHETDPQELGSSKRCRLTCGTSYKTHDTPKNSAKRTAADIIFTRCRMFYGRPVMGKDTHGHNRTMLVGLPPSHVLNCLAPISLTSANEVPSEENILGRDVRHVLKHIFPRQFGMKSVFAVTKNETKATDYKIDINAEILLQGNVKTPKRLKSTLSLVEKLVKRHWACNYRSIRSISCPSKVKKAKLKKRAPLDDNIILEIMSETYNSQGITTQQDHDLLDQSYSSSAIQRHTTQARKEAKIKPRFAEFTCSYHEVYRFIRKATLAVIPFGFWGCKANFNNTMKYVKMFISGRRLETFTLHTVMQGFSTQECEWLLPSDSRALQQRPCVTDALKRRELVEEFLYWYFDSFIIPLIKTTFYVTDSGALRQRIIYFRLDDWTALCRPLLQNLANGPFEKINTADAEAMLRYKRLDASYVRLLPKETGVRPIVNLRRKFKNQRNGHIPLSINQVLQAAFQVLKYEKANHPELIGAAVFGQHEIYAKLKHFKVRIMDKYKSIPKLYFVKLDVKACFDTIDQSKLIQILVKLFTDLTDDYMIHRSVQVIPMADKIQRIFVKQALPYSQCIITCASGGTDARFEAEHPHFISYATKLANMIKHAVLVDQVVYSHEEKKKILELLKEHITENLVKIGSDYYRQVTGIPQGSILSTLLCSFFYGDLERQKYNFTDDPDCLLCRLVDDYLFITPSLEKAKGFLQTMSQGHPEYGCFITPEKTLINFDSSLYIMNTIPHGQEWFPWCGLLINMTDLSVRGDYSRYNGHIGDTLTIDRRRHPWTAFEHKMLQMARLRSHPLFWDAALNSPAIIYRNVYENFLLVGMKMRAYIRDWKIDLSNEEVVKTLADVILRTIQYTFRLIRSKANGTLATSNTAICNLSEDLVLWLGLSAFQRVLEYKKPSPYFTLVGLLNSQARRPKYAHLPERWRGMTTEADKLLHRLRF